MCLPIICTCVYICMSVDICMCAYICMDVCMPVQIPISGIFKKFQSWPNIGSLNVDLKRIGTHSNVSEVKTIPLLWETDASGIKIKEYIPSRYEFTPSLHRG